MSQIAVIGAGLMGHGIALTFARAGHNVALFDPVARKEYAMQGERLNFRALGKE